MDALYALLDCALGFFPCYFLLGCKDTTRSEGEKFSCSTMSRGAHGIRLHHHIREQKSCSQDYQKDIPWYLYKTPPWQRWLPRRCHPRNRGSGIQCRVGNHSHRSMHQGTLQHTEASQTSPKMQRWHFNGMEWSGIQHSRQREPGPAQRFLLVSKSLKLYLAALKTSHSRAMFACAAHHFLLRTSSYVATEIEHSIYVRSG